MSYDQYDNYEFECIESSFYDINNKDIYLSKKYSELRSDVIKFISKSVYYYWNENKYVWTRTDNFSYLKNDISDVLSRYIINIKNQFYPYYEGMVLSKQQGRPVDEDKISSYTKQLEKVDKVLENLGSDSKLNAIKNLTPCHLFDENFESNLNSMATLLPVPMNLVIDLETGELRGREKEDMFTFELSTKYIKTIDTSEIEKIFSDMFLGHEETIRFMQRFLGYCLTGLNTERKFVILWGPQGKNGKTTLANMMNSLLERYFLALDRKTFDSRVTGSGAEPYLLKARGKRCSFMSEPTKEVDSEKLKSFVGNDEINPRALGKNPDERGFINASKLMIAYNNPLNFPNDPALFDRIINIPCLARFVKVKTEEHHIVEDPKLLNRIRQPDFRSKLFKWCIEGCKEWFKQGLNEPSLIVESTNDFKKNSDSVSMFLDQCVDPTAEDPFNTSDDVHLLYTKWCEDNSRTDVLNKDRLCKQIAQLYGTNIRAKNKYDQRGFRLDFKPTSEWGDKDIPISSNDLLIRTMHKLCR